jgi:hypothetical protein
MWWILLAMFFPIIVGIVIGLFDDFKQKHKENTSSELFIRGILFWIVVATVIILIKTN